MTVLLCDTRRRARAASSTTCCARRRPAGRGHDRRLPRPWSSAARIEARRHRVRARRSRDSGGAELMKRLRASSPGPVVAARPSPRPRLGRRGPGRRRGRLRPEGDGPEEVLRAIRPGVRRRGRRSPAGAPAARRSDSRDAIAARASSSRARRASTSRRRDGREGRVPGEHLPRAPDARDRREGHRVRAAEPPSPTTSGRSSSSSSRPRSTS